MNNHCIWTTDARGITKIKCPHCKEVLFQGFYMGITITDVKECWKCNKRIEVFKNENK